MKIQISPSDIQNRTTVYSSVNYTATLSILLKKKHMGLKEQKLFFPTSGMKTKNSKK